MRKGPSPTPPMRPPLAPRTGGASTPPVSSNTLTRPPSFNETAVTLPSTASTEESTHAMSTSMQVASSPFRPKRQEAELEALRQRGLAKLLNKHFTEATQKLAQEKASVDAALRDLEARKKAMSRSQSASSTQSSKQARTVAPNAEKTYTEDMFHRINQRRAQCRQKERETLLLYQRYVHKFGFTGQIRLPGAAASGSRPPPGPPPPAVGGILKGSKGSAFQKFTGGNTDKNLSSVGSASVLNTSIQEGEGGTTDPRILTSVVTSKGFNVLDQGKSSSPPSSAGGSMGFHKSAAPVPITPDSVDESPPGCVPVEDSPSETTSGSEVSGKANAARTREAASTPHIPLPTLSEQSSLEYGTSSSPEMPSDHQSAYTQQSEVHEVAECDKSVSRFGQSTITTPVDTTDAEEVEGEIATQQERAPHLLSQFIEHHRPVRSDDDDDLSSLISGLTSVNSATTRQILADCEVTVATFLDEERRAIRSIMKQKSAEEDQSDSVSDSTSGGADAITRDSSPISFDSGLESNQTLAAVEAENMVVQMKKILQDYQESHLGLLTSADSVGGRTYPTGNPNEKWNVLYDPTYQREYYYEVNSKRTQWNPPPQDGKTNTRGLDEYLDHNEFLPETHGDGQVTPKSAPGGRVAKYRQRMKRQFRRRLMYGFLALGVCSVGAWYIRQGINWPKFEIPEWGTIAEEEEYEDDEYDYEYDEDEDEDDYGYYYQEQEPEAYEDQVHDSWWRTVEYEDGGDAPSENSLQVSSPWWNQGENASGDLEAQVETEGRPWACNVPLSYLPSENCRRLARDKPAFDVDELVMTMMQ